MAHLFEDYREIDNVRNKLDFLIELVSEAPRRVFITRRGEVLAVVLSPKDYDELWWHELDADMKAADAETETYTTEQVMQHMAYLQEKLRQGLEADLDEARRA